MIYDINCPRCVMKMSRYFAKTKNIEELTKLCLEDDLVILDRLDKL